ncbi:MAG: coproporphyrinogen III oxidase [Myxococcota bacterium]|nr:coproporphyrinogen III oxidase [Myxococcota bacterium]
MSGSVDFQTPSSEHARQVLSQLTKLQHHFRDGVDMLSQRFGDGATLEYQSWRRDEGRHGGGWRYEASEAGILNRGSLNISAVHYDDLPQRRLSSATALSCIIHPAHPKAPSLHMHVSWTELRDGVGGGWRLMADLNPSIPNDVDTGEFRVAVERGLDALPKAERGHAFAQGDRYFYIPALERTRGVAHCYLEQWRGGDFHTERQIAGRFISSVIGTYLSILERAYSERTEPTVEERLAQLDYHTLYFLQVLTLDRGTSSGLLVHNQNDRGILGSLPMYVSPQRLQSWVERLPVPQDQLLMTLIAALPVGEPVRLDGACRERLAAIVRAHYQEKPEALSLQARGDRLPPTVAQHNEGKTPTHIEAPERSPR